MKNLLSKLPLYMAYLCMAIIVLMPLHAFLTVWASNAFGFYTGFRLWKEVLLLVLFGGLVVLFIRKNKVRSLFRTEAVLGLSAVYVLLLLVSGLVAYFFEGVSLKAFAYGLILDSRYLIFFGITWVVSLFFDGIVRRWKQLLLMPATIVVGFATLQWAALPADFLKHFGYGPDTIRPSVTIDQKDAYTRIQSTLRGPNPFGAYLVVILSALSGLIIRMKKLQPSPAVLYILAGLALVFTFSRSAWIGAVVSIGFLIWVSVTSPLIRKALLVAGASGLLVFAAVLYGLRENDHFQNIFFHTNEHSVSAESSNTGHVNAVLGGIRDIARAPLGSGTGTAGPASVYNNDKVRISENYFVQIGQEVGVIGLGLFITIYILVAVKLWNRRHNNLALTLLASFVGITMINLFMHAWTDDTLAYIWWGLAGAAMTISPTRHTSKEDH